MSSALCRRPAGEADQDNTGRYAAVKEGEDDIGGGPPWSAHQFGDDDGLPGRRCCAGHREPIGVRFAKDPTSQPTATPVRATCPMPSPGIAGRLCTRYVPTTGAERPTRSAAMKE